MKKLTQDEIVAALIRLKLRTLREISDLGGDQTYNLQFAELLSDRALQVAKGEATI